MKTGKKRRFGLLALLLMAAPLWGTPASAVQFEQAEINNPENFVIVAAPAGRIGYGLLIIEQVKNDRPCWDEVETGPGPTIVDPLLTRFDFTGICGRGNDSNAYSVRTGGEDLGLQYSLRVLRQGNDLVLVAASNRQRNLNIPIGRTYGLPQPGEFVRIRLDPGWRLSRRIFNGRSTGHVYLTNDQPISVLIAAATSPTATAGPILPPSLPNPQSPSRPPLLPPTGSTSPLTEPSPRGTPQPGTTLPGTSTAPVQIPVPPPESPRANSGNPSGAGSGNAPSANSGTNSGTNLGTNPGTNPPPVTTPRATLPPLPSRPAAGTPAVPPVTTPRATLPPLPNRPAAGTPAVPPPPAPPASTTAGTPASRPLPLPNPPATTATRPLPLPNSPSSGGTAPTPSVPSTPTTPITPGTTPPPLSTAPTPSQSASLPQPPQQQATGIVYGYRVIVAADSAELQDRVRSLAPQTQIVTVNGQPAVQAGLFRDLNSAEQLRRRLAGENLSVTIVPIR